MLREPLKSTKMILVVRTPEKIENHCLNPSLSLSYTNIEPEKLEKSVLKSKEYEILD